MGYPMHFVMQGKLKIKYLEYHTSVLCDKITLFGQEQNSSSQINLYFCHPSYRFICMKNSKLENWLMCRPKIHMKYNVKPLSMY